MKLITLLIMAASVLWMRYDFTKDYTKTLLIGEPEPGDELYIPTWKQVLAYWFWRHNRIPLIETYRKLRTQVEAGAAGETEEKFRYLQRVLSADDKG